MTGIKKRLGSLLGPEGRTPQFVGGETTQVEPHEPAKVGLTKTGPAEYRMDVEIPRATSESSPIDIEHLSQSPIWIVHSDDAGYPRPQTLRPVEWFGSVEPANMLDGDVWSQFEHVERYSTDFQNGMTDWTPFMENAVWEVAEGEGYDGSNAIFGDSAEGRRGLLWNDKTFTDVEVLSRVRQSFYPTSYNTGGVIVRASGTDDSPSGYMVFVRGTLARLTRYRSGGYVVLETINFPAMPENAWYWIRLRAYGDQIQAKVWLDGEPERDAWDFNVTDTSVTDAGGVGLVSAATGDTLGGADCYWDNFGVSGDGGTARVI